MISLIKKVALFFSGSVVLHSTSLLFDYVLYPFVIYKAGLIKGFSIMLLFSFLFCLLFIIIYNKLKKDVFALEYSKEKINKFIEKTGGNWFQSLFRSILKKSKIIFFIFLSFYDPFIATVFMRKNYQYSKMTLRDWKVLVISVIIGNGIWAPTIFCGVSITEFFYKFMMN